MDLTKISCKMPLVICVVLFLLEKQLGALGSRCLSAEEATKPTSVTPTVEMNNLEFPNEHVLPTGYNITVVCTSNHPAKSDHKVYLPYWMQYFFNDVYKRELSCGGGNSDSDYERSKVCKYFIQNATEDNSGNYTCISRNLYGCTMKTMALMFKEPSPPLFTHHQPREVDFLKSSKAKLSCNASGVPLPSITWFKDGNSLSSSSVIGSKSYSILNFESVHAHDQGQYWCEANNTEGQSRSAPVNLTVVWKPAFYIHPQDTTVYLDDDATTVTVNLSCAAHGSPLPVISWLKNNSKVDDDAVIRSQNISILTVEIKEGTEKHFRYRCVAKNSLGNTSSQEATLMIAKRDEERLPMEGIVEGESPFYLQPRSIKAIAGDHVDFVCAIEGSPVSQIVWLKDGSANLDGNTDYFSGEQSAISVLKIYPVSERHVGRYSCEATRFAGTAISREAVLVITDKESSRSTLCISKAVWVPVATGAFVLLLIVISIFFAHVRNKNAKFSIAKKMREDNQFPHLHTQDDMISQERGDSKAPRYQMTNLAFTNL